MPDNSPKVNGAPEDTPGEGLPSRDDHLFAPPRRIVVPRPVYRGKLRKALSSRVNAHLRAWSVERFQLGLLSIFVFGVLGVFIADTIFCPADTGMRFWDGCTYEVIVLGAGGGVLGLRLFFILSRLFSPKPTQDS